MYDLLLVNEADSLRCLLVVVVVVAVIVLK